MNLRSLEVKYDEDELSEKYGFSSSDSTSSNIAEFTTDPSLNRYF